MHFQHFDVENFLWSVFTSEKNGIIAKKVGFFFILSTCDTRGIAIEFKKFSREKTKIQALIVAADPKKALFRAKTAYHFASILYPTTYQQAIRVNTTNDLNKRKLLSYRGLDLRKSLFQLPVSRKPPVKNNKPTVWVGCQLV